MKADYHMHSAFSGDCDTPMEDMVKGAVEKKLETICFTEHMDLAFPTEGIDFEVDMTAYEREYFRLKQKYQGKIEILFGIELGLQPHIAKQEQEFVNKYPFDFVIGSLHLLDGVDPYYPECFSGYQEEERYHRYFASIIENLKVFSDIDTFGHLDYVVRYGPDKNKYYTFEAYADILECVLKVLIEKGIGLEINTAGYKYGLEQPNPSTDVIRRYRELGGEIITIGADAHKPEHIAHSYIRACELLKSCGFTHYSIFRKRKAEFVKL